ncbi:hypothetical protein AWZ03_000570 [Drosophila navojoa]|uniref:Uncharacterized protein n=1 Tax=Drosophila navojoa TaxID=7232 RepID=A0A484BW17_DRONA|nr:hypothetical protein AWZ03_000570 [Drosophila navojoa]
MISNSDSNSNSNSNCGSYRDKLPAVTLRHWDAVWLLGWLRRCLGQRHPSAEECKLQLCRWRNKRLTGHVCCPNWLRLPPLPSGPLALPQLPLPSPQSLLLLPGLGLGLGLGLDLCLESRVSQSGSESKSGHDL